MFRQLACPILFLAAYPLTAQSLTVAAAADLAPLAPQLASAFQARTGIPVTFSLGSSGLLRQQIEQGAPFDVYLSANQDFVTQLEKKGLTLAGSVRLYATGRLGLWTPSGSIQSIRDLRNPRLRHLAIPNPAHAPYGVAAMEAIQNAGLLEALRPKLVFGENVRQAFEFARTGNAEAVITSWTLLKDQNALLLPAAAHNPIRQAAAAIARTPHRKEALAFLDWLLSPEAQAILRSAGLFPPETSRAPPPSR
jgi:molybdate transport system substrate-binding protein